MLLMVGMPTMDTLHKISGTSAVHSHVTTANAEAERTALSRST